MLRANVICSDAYGELCAAFIEAGRPAATLGFSSKFLMVANPSGCHVCAKVNTKPYRNHSKARKILANLQQKASFKANVFDEADFMPMRGVPEHKDGKFNLFTGFKVEPVECIESDPDLALVLNHFREVIADGNDAYYQYVLNWFAHAFQRPNRKVGTMLVWQGGQGAGKNIILDWIGEQIFGPMYCALNNLEQLTQKFNSFQIGKLFIVLNEIQSHGGSFRDADKLKSIVTDKERMAEPGRQSILRSISGRINT